MRTIKFRAWHDGMMYDVSHLHFNVNGLAFADMINENTMHLYHGRPGSFELMQFTGLHDASGKEIYEGDIVKAYPKNGWPVDDQRVVVYAIVFSEFEGCWILKDERPAEDCPALYRGGMKSRQDELLEVIGNIYDNPELLQE